MRKVKAFYAPDGVEEYFGFFSIKEDANFFYGYKMSKEPGTYSIILQHGTRKNPDDIYIICDYMCKISKSIRLNRMILDYDIYALRDLTDSLKMNVVCKCQYASPQEEVAVIALAPAAEAPMQVDIALCSDSTGIKPVSTRPSAT